MTPPRRQLAVSGLAFLAFILNLVLASPFFGLAFCCLTLSASLFIIPACLSFSSYYMNSESLFCLISILADSADPSCVILPGLAYLIVKKIGLLPMVNKSQSRGGKFNSLLESRSKQRHEAWHGDISSGKLEGLNGRVRPPVRKKVQSTPLPKALLPL